MKEFTLDCREINDKAELHKALAEGLSLPDWYGNNLDALHDCLTGISEDVCIIVKEFDVLEERLGKYALSLRRIMLDSAEENDRVRAAFI